MTLETAGRKDNREAHSPSIYAYRADKPGAPNLPLYLNQTRVDVVRQSPEWQGPYRNMRTGRLIEIRSAPCGLGCYCAAEWRYWIARTA